MNRQYFYSPVKQCVWTGLRSLIFALATLSGPWQVTFLSQASPGLLLRSSNSIQQLVGVHWYREVFIKNDCSAVMWVRSGISRTAHPLTSYFVTSGAPLKLNKRISLHGARISIFSNLYRFCVFPSITLPSMNPSINKFVKTGNLLVKFGKTPRPDARRVPTFTKPRKRSSSASVSPQPIALSVFMAPNCWKKLAGKDCRLIYWIRRFPKFFAAGPKSAGRWTRCGLSDSTSTTRDFNGWNASSWMYDRLFLFILTETTAFKHTKESLSIRDMLLFAKDIFVSIQGIFLGISVKPMLFIDRAAWLCGTRNWYTRIVKSILTVNISVFHR